MAKFRALCSSSSDTGSAAIRRNSATTVETASSINGGIESLAQAKRFLDRGIDGVMIGRAAYQSPWGILGTADAEIWGEEAGGMNPEEVTLVWQGIEWAPRAGQVVRITPQNGQRMLDSLNAAR